MTRQSYIYIIEEQYVTLSSIEERHSKTEGKPVGSIDNEEENGKSSSLPNSTIEICIQGSVDMSVVALRKNFLNAKRLGSSNSRNGLFGETSAFCRVLECKPVVLREYTPSKISGGITYAANRETNAFMIPPVMAMTGKIEDIAKAKRQDRA